MSRWLLIFCLFACAPAQALNFWQDEWQVPAQLQTNDYVLTPLSNDDATAFYKAYFSSQSFLYHQLGWAWPSEKATPEMNTEMVRYQVEQHLQRRAFTFIIRPRNKDTIVGALYLVPILEQRSDVPGLAEQQYDAELSWWLTERESSSDSAERLLSQVLPWLATQWPWQNLLLPVATTNEVALAQVRRQGLSQVAEDKDNATLFFSYRAR